jgi:hypothetical protein
MLLDAALEKLSKKLKSPRCGYRSFDTVYDAQLWEHLHPTIPSSECEPPELRKAGGDQAESDLAIFNGFEWAEWTSHNWQIPIIACVVYLIGIVALNRWMRDRKPIRLQPVVLAWNFGLSLFSLAGMCYCVPHLLFSDYGLFTRGFTATVCTHATSYGQGRVGLFVALFIYSKVAELVDTLWLTLRKAPVIFLHWYHHVTVLLYCWHSYSCRIGTGLWYASMNYSVHSIMYFYFGLTQTGPTGKRLAKKVSMFITTIQLLQMVMGIVVTVYSMVQHAQGKTCFVSLANSLLGMLMYASYFALFLQLFLSHYVYSKKPKPPKDRETELGMNGNTASNGSACPSDAEAIKQAADAVTRGQPPGGRTKAA